MSVAAHAAPREARNPFAGAGRWISTRTRRAGSAVAAGAYALRSHGGTVRSVVLQVGGLAGFTVTAWAAHPIAGGAVGSTALFVLNFLLSDPRDEQR